MIPAGVMDAPHGGDNQRAVYGFWAVYSPLIQKHNRR
jgi:hypothetical protein